MINKSRNKNKILIFGFEIFFRIKRENNPVDTGRKLNVLCTFNLRPASTGKRKPNKPQHQQEKKTVSCNKVHICHCRKDEDNRKRTHYHCQMCGKPVLKFNMKHVVCAKKEMKKRNIAKAQFAQRNCWNITRKTMINQLLRTISRDLFIIYTKQRLV